jgi:hypothetical protein
MAKIVCTVTYNKRAKKVIQTYQIEFEKQDKFEMRTPNEDLALMVERKDPAAKKLVKRWKTTRNAKTVAARSTDREPSDVYIVDPAKQNTPTGNPVPIKTFPACFTVPAAHVAKFICGYYEANPKAGEKEFTPYPGGVGLSFPPIP